MNFPDDWRNEKYQTTFEEELRALERRSVLDKTFCITEIEGTLETLYLSDGSDWLGRGELQDIILSAAIAAHEHFITEWKSAQGKNEKNV